MDGPGWPHPEPWEWMRLLGYVTFLLGFGAVFVAGARRGATGSGRHLAGPFVIACGVVSIVAGAMTIGKVQLPYYRVGPPCYQGAREDGLS